MIGNNFCFLVNDANEKTINSKELSAELDGLKVKGTQYYWITLNSYNKSKPDGISFYLRQRFYTEKSKIFKEPFGYQIASCGAVEQILNLNETVINLKKLLSNPTDLKIIISEMVNSESGKSKVSIDKVIVHMKRLDDKSSEYEFYLVFDMNVIDKKTKRFVDKFIVSKL